MITLSNIFGWDYFADWSSENSLKNFPVVNIETAVALAWQERYAWSPTRDEVIALYKRNFATIYDFSGIAYWWLTLVPHVKTNGEYVIYDGEMPPSGADSGYGWKGIAVKGDTIPNLVPVIGNTGYLVYVGCGYIPDFITWPYALSVAEMEDLIGETILPYPYDWPLFSAKYYLQFYKILNAVRHRLYYNYPSSWFTGLTDNTWSNISASAAAALLARNNIYSLYVYSHENGSAYDVRLKTVKSGQIAKYHEDCYIRLVSADNVFWPGSDAGYTLYKHFDPDDTFIIDPPQVPAPGKDTYLFQAIELASIEDRVPVADKFIFRN